MKDTLGDRMKSYESTTRFLLNKRSYTIIRIDGKAFHTYTKGLTRPFDEGLINDMDETAIYLCSNIQGAKCAFVQSDEITIVITDFDTLETSAWFDNQVQKMCSVSASLATSIFNELRRDRWFEYGDEGSKKPVLAHFDSRVFQLPTRTEVENCLIWRQQDTVRNSISSVAQSLYSHNELHGKSTNDMQEMIFKKGINWNDYPGKWKRGRFISKENYSLEDGSVRSKWVSIAPPTFTQDRDFLKNYIPNNE